MLCTCLRYWHTIVQICSLPTNIQNCSLDTIYAEPAHAHLIDFTLTHTSLVERALAKRGGATSIARLCYMRVVVGQIILRLSGIYNCTFALLVKKERPASPKHRDIFRQLFPFLKN